MVSQPGGTGVEVTNGDVRRRFRDSWKSRGTRGSRDFSVKLPGPLAKGRRRVGTWSTPTSSLARISRDTSSVSRASRRPAPSRVAAREDGDANVRPPTSEDVVVFEKRATERHSSEVAVGPCARRSRLLESSRARRAETRSSSLGRASRGMRRSGCSCAARRGVWRRVVVKTHVFHTFVLTWHLRESDFRARAKNEPSHVETAMKRQNEPTRAFAATLLRGRREWGRPHVHFTRHKTAHRALRIVSQSVARESLRARDAACSTLDASRGVQLVKLVRQL